LNIIFWKLPAWICRRPITIPSFLNDFRELRMERVSIYLCTFKVPLWANDCSHIIYVALVLFFARGFSFVNCQTSVIGETLITYVSRVWLFVCVFLSVNHQTTVIGWTLIIYVSRVRFFVCVFLSVNRQTTVIGWTLITDVARGRLLACVSSPVPSNRHCEWTIFHTRRTGTVLWLCVSADASLNYCFDRNTCRKLRTGTTVLRLQVGLFILVYNMMLITWLTSTSSHGN